MFSKLARITLATALAAGASVAAAAPAHAGPERAVLGLKTDAILSGTTLTVVAVGSFDGGIVANNAVALQVAGTETYIDSSGNPVTVPLAGAPFAVRFANSNTVQWQWSLNSADSTVHVDWTAEATGLAPTPFVGSCAGTFSYVARTPAEIEAC